MNWFILILAGLFEIVWAVGLKYTDGFIRLQPTVGTLLAMLISFGLLGMAMESLHGSTVYAVWLGIGMVGLKLATSAQQMFYDGINADLQVNKYLQVWL